MLPSARTALRALPFAALLLAGCGMLDARLEARTVCYTLADYPIPAAGVSGSVSTDISYDLGSDLPIVNEQGVSYSLELTRISLSVGAASPAVDLGTLDQLVVSVAPPAGSSLPALPAIHYSRGSDPHPAVIEAASSTGADLAPHVAGGVVVFHADATGSAPAYAWTADVTGCFLLTVDVNYGKKL